MIKSKRTDVLTAIAIGLALIVTALLVIFGDSEAARLARQPEYVDSLFGDELISIDIQADQETWDGMIANASAKEYIMADIVINGVKYKNIGVRAKGNATLSQVSRSSSPQRYSLHVKFDEYINNQTCKGLDELILNNLISDSTYMKEYMSQDIMRFIGVQSPLTNYADITVNGEGFGFYVALESYGDSYNERVFEDTTGNYYNVKSMQMGGGNRNMGEGNRNVNGDARNFGGGDRNMGEIMNGAQAVPSTGGAFIAPNDGRQADVTERPDNAAPNTAGAIDNAAGARQGVPGEPATEDWNDRAGFIGRGGGSNGGSLEYTDDDPASYPAIFENSIGTVSTAEQRKVVKALENLSTGTDLEKYFDVDEILRYFAAHTVVVNLDSYYSGMAQNYYVLERNGVVSILPWDYHLSFGGFQSGSAGSVVNFPIDTPVSGVTMESRPLLNMLLSDEQYLARYHDYLREIVDDYYNSGLFEQTVKNLQAKIADNVKDDPTAYFTYEQFRTGVDALIELNLLRAESIEGQLDGKIPSTTDGQSDDSANLIDASSLNMSDLGSMGMGGGARGGGGFGGATQGAIQGGPGGDFPGMTQGGMQGGPGGNVPGATQGGMQANPGGNFPGATQGGMQANPGGNFPGATQGAVQGGPGGNFPGATQGGMQGGFPAGSNSYTSTALTKSDYIMYAILVLILAGTIVFAAKFKKRNY